MVNKVNLRRGIVKGLGHDDAECLGKSEFVSRVVVGAHAGKILGEVAF